MNPFSMKGVFIGSGPSFNIELAVTAFKYCSTEYSGSIAVKIICVLFDVVHRCCMDSLSFEMILLCLLFL